MAKLNVRRSIIIEAPIEKVYAILSDFNLWKTWSPWLIMEPNAEVKVSEGGKAFSWDGKVVGSGQMKVLSEDPDKRIDYDLTFLKPWKSKAKTWFTLSSNGSATEVSWFMDSSLPFFLFWMKKLMNALIGMDYVRGLNMLKDFAEKGHVESSLTFNGFSDSPGMSFVGIRTESTLKGVGEAMSSDFARLEPWCETNQELLNGVPFSQYHKWDMVNEKVIYTCGFPVKNIPEVLPEGFTSGTIPSTRVHGILHKGKYVHLGNAWSAQMNMKQAKVFKQNKKIHPFEVYYDMPGSIPESELRTEVFFPVK